MEMVRQASGSKRKHTTLSLVDKLKIAEEAEAGVTSRKQIAKKWGVGESSVGRFLQNKAAIQLAVEKHREHGLKHRKTLKEQHYPLMEEALFIWILQQREANIIVPADILRAKGESLFREFQKHGCYCDQSFLASKGWAQRFKERQGLRMGDEKAASGRKLNKTRYTLMPCSNYDGSLKLKLMFIGTSENPRDLPRGADKGLPVSYYFSKKAWMTRVLFRKWFEDESVPIVRKFCSERNMEPKALLVLDNCSAHHDAADKLVGTHTDEDDVNRWLNDKVVDSDGNLLSGTRQVSEMQVSEMQRMKQSGWMIPTKMFLVVH
ncbi:jerky protein homolog-like [Aedes albopictus]|uniref:HTH CENPB-type domain-containing protein n=1 Tax=Aedes albopictus TaxID=7160 RepID=A0ABM1Y6C7_AEDAL